MRIQMRAGRLVAVVAALVVVLARAVVAQTGPALVLRNLPKDRAFEMSADARVFGQTETEDDADVDLSIYESRGRFSLMPKSKPELRLGYELKYLDFSSETAAIPDRLTDQSIGAGMIFEESNGWTTAFTLGLGYAGDTSFSDGQGWYARGSLSFTKRMDENRQLVLLLDYDGNRPVFPDIPLPGIAYTFKPAETVSLTLGFPINSVVWRPDDRWTIEARALLWYDITARLTYKIDRHWAVFAELDRRTDAFHLDELEENNDRLLFQQRRVEAGLRWMAGDGLRVVFAGGYAFSQEFSSGFDSRDDHQLVELDDAPYLRAGVEISF